MLSGSMGPISPIYLLAGQFFHEGIEIDESWKLLLLGPDMEPVPVMRKLNNFHSFQEKYLKSVCTISFSTLYKASHQEITVTSPIYS